MRWLHCLFALTSSPQSLYRITAFISYCSPFGSVFYRFKVLEHLDNSEEANWSCVLPWSWTAHIFQRRRSLLCIRSWPCFSFISDTNIFLRIGSHYIYHCAESKHFSCISLYRVSTNDYPDFNWLYFNSETNWINFAVDKLLNSSWLHFTVHYYTRSSVHSHHCRCLVAASAVDIPLPLGSWAIPDRS
jgi:hypothetical protein